MAWITADIIGIGTSQNELVFIEGGCFKGNFMADNIDLIDFELDTYVFFHISYILLHIGLLL